MKKTRSQNAKSVLWMLLLSIAIPFTPAGKKYNHKTTAQQKDSINYYRLNTMINWDLIEKRIRK